MNITERELYSTFARLVKKMREAQKHYFKSRTKTDLEFAKMYEQEIDDYLADHPELLRDQRKSIQAELFRSEEQNSAPTAPTLLHKH